MSLYFDFKRQLDSIGDAVLTDDVGYLHAGIRLLENLKSQRLVESGLLDQSHVANKLAGKPYFEAAAQ